MPVKKIMNFSRFDMSLIVQPETRFTLWALDRLIISGIEMSLNLKCQGRRDVVTSLLSTIVLNNTV